VADPTIEQVREFWEQNPLWDGESRHAVGTHAFFEEHEQVYIQDCFAGKLDQKIFPDEGHRGNVLDLGCGPGFWTLQLLRLGCTQVMAADLTENAIQLANERCHLHGYKNVKFSRQNAENLNLGDEEFDHVNCQGVIHHTPNTESCIAEIARVLKSGGTALISVYHQNWILRNWPKLSWLGGAISGTGGGLKGRGRENIMACKDTAEIVRLYDGEGNPLGKAYTTKAIRQMLDPHFHVGKIFYHYFPARSLPIPVPGVLHRFLDRRMGFMVYLFLPKREI